MVYTSPKEQRFEVRTFGDPSRRVVEFDGLVLMRRQVELRPKTRVREPGED